MDKVKLSRLIELGYCTTGDGVWSHGDYNYPVYLERDLEMDRAVGVQGAVKSDGGSSSYYELTINSNHVETSDVIRDAFGNDFDLGNMFKSMVRIQSTRDGKGKAGTSTEYDLNKIIFTCNKLKELL